MMLTKTLATAVVDLLYELKEIDEKISNDDNQIECFESVVNNREPQRH